MSSGGKGRPIAYGISAELFQRIEQYLEAHKGLSKKGFVAGLILRELDAQEVPNPDDSPDNLPHTPERVEDTGTSADIPAEPEETTEDSLSEDGAE